MIVMDGARRAWHLLPVPTGVRTALFVVRQLCWRASRAPLGIVYRRHEDREVARVRALLGHVPTAEGGDGDRHVPPARRDSLRPCDRPSPRP